MRTDVAAPAVTARVFEDHWDHVAAELRLLDLLLAKVVARRRRQRRGERGASWGHGMFIGEDEVDALVGSHDADAAVLRREIEIRGENSVAQGTHLPLSWIVRVFGLSRWELQVLMLVFAPELDPKYERIYAYLHDDIRRPRPSVDLALTLLGEDLQVRAEGRTAFALEMPLRRGGLLVLGDNGADDGSSSLQVRLDARICALLLGVGEKPTKPWLRHLRPRLPALPDPGLESIVALARGRLAGVPPKVVFALEGNPADARTVAEYVCGTLEVRLITIDLLLLTASGLPFLPTLRAAVREALLEPGALLLEHAARIAETDAETELRVSQLATALEDFAWLSFVSDRDPLRGAAHARRAWIHVEAAPLAASTRAGYWTAAFADAGVEMSPTVADSLASRYRLAPSEIDGVVAVVKPTSANPESSLAAVEAACREAPGTSFGGLAHRFSPRFQWTDIVLARNQHDQLRHLVDAVRSRGRVMGDWGFGHKLLRGRGICALFAGPSGTGKTMAAEVLGHELGLDLYTVDLAMVVSKFIGETEKNLARVFDTAEASGGLLVINECDALLGKRTEIRDAHDRFANIEVAYLLQRVETYSGLVVLTTNARANIDDAFLRRLDFLIDFHFPEAAERLHIWHTTVPTQAAVADDIDWRYLADTFALAGGNIRSAIVHAAYRAAAHERAIGMADLILGVRRELEKLGRAPGPSDFGRYAHLVVE